MPKNLEENSAGKLVINKEEDKTVYEVRKQKLAALRRDGFNFPNQFRPQHLTLNLFNKYNQFTKENLAQQKNKVSIAGRIVLRRLMGKASFMQIQDGTGRMQIYVQQNNFPKLYAQFKHWDLGDLIGIKGELCKTNTGELTIHAEQMELLAKSLRPLPDKFHGISDRELAYRKRYVDLITNDLSRQIFLIRTKLIKAIRNFMDEHGFIEVETPMMHPIQGGALARPFVTYHQALDQEMYLRIAPELYLKRLIVGGFERVYEINRNFRNEGISTRHNPEFTMIEFYQAYATYQDLMQFTEELLADLCDQILGTRLLKYQGTTIDFTKPIAKMKMTEAISHYLNVNLAELATINGCQKIINNLKLPYFPSDCLGKLQLILFEEKVEELLLQPTFITGYPTAVSPLARQSDDDPEYTDRFELFIAGREIANGFSELNDPEDQAARFRQQTIEKNAGDLEAMHYDHDYIEALEYGMPPTAGEGIGIDRLVMLFTNSASIRDVILFPQLRKEAREINKGI